MSGADAARIIELLELIERHSWWTYIAVCIVGGLQTVRLFLK